MKIVIVALLSFATIAVLFAFISGVLDSSSTADDHNTIARCRRVTPTSCRETVAPEIDSKGAESCKELNRLEATADSQRDLQAKGVAEYVDALKVWRNKHSGPQPTCRLKVLNSALCRLGIRLSKTNRLGVNLGMPSDFDSLLKNILQPDLCQKFDEFFPAWFAMDPDPCEKKALKISWLMKDPYYMDMYNKATIHPYGPPCVSKYFYLLDGVRGVEEKMFLDKRVDNLNYLRLLRRAAPGWEIGKTKQWVEFGAGAADMAATMIEMGFQGSYFIVDLPPMLPMQQYWLRYSGIPAFLGQDADVTPSMSDFQGKIILETSMNDTALHGHLNPAFNRDSVFFATWSFTEADLETRARFEYLLQSFGTIFLIFWADFKASELNPTAGVKDISNDWYLMRLLDEGLMSTHNVLVWKPWKSPGFYFIARDKNLGPLVCPPEHNCHLHTSHQLFNQIFLTLRFDRAFVASVFAMSVLLAWRAFKYRAFTSRSLLKRGKEVAE